MESSIRQEIEQGERFQFGKNWDNFLSVLNEERIAEAGKFLREMLEVEDLQDLTFLDAGSGSGLFSLAARRLGAKVFSFDYDPDSVACTRELKRRYFPNDSEWMVEEGSVLNGDYMKKIGEFDVVYSWGVLHHTGEMWKALENIISTVKSGGYLFIAIYNDQGAKSDHWRKIKRFYCSGPLGKAAVCGLFIPYFMVRRLAGDLLRRENPLHRYTKVSTRGMTMLYDWLDWLGGLPFEVAKPEEIFRFYKDRGFVLKNLMTAGGGVGNNQFVFVKQ